MSYFDDNEDYIIHRSTPGFSRAPRAKNMASNNKKTTRTVTNTEERMQLGVKEVRFGVTKNMGNFESERIDVTVERINSEPFDDLVKRARGLCYRGLGDIKSRRKKNALREAAKRRDWRTLDALLDDNGANIGNDDDDDDIPFG